VKAFALTVAGQPASLVDLPDPEAPDGGLRVRIRNASVNGFDLFEASGGLAAMMPHELPTVVGRDFSGVVDAVGAGRTDVAVGDEVLGFIPSDPPLHDGSWAELVARGADLIVAPKPAGLTFVVAAAIPLAGATALDAVEAVEPGPGDIVLVAGATGGVGSIALQLAVQRGATVIATGKSGEGEAFVRSLGATETVDYTAGDVADTIRARHPGGITVLIDTVNRNEAFARLVEVVRDGGRASTVLGAADVDGLAARSIKATNVRGAPTAAKLTVLVDQVLAGRLRIQIQDTFPLAEAPAAIAAFDAGARGKLVLEM
jgi:NADPH:quinone reductase-like Zn-dependent oxidoreductase